MVFTDLEGFTAFTDTHGDTAAVKLIEEDRQFAGPVVRQWSGKILKTLGDGLLCTFPDAETGVRAALELSETAPAPLRLRAGVHVGEAVVTKGDVMVTSSMSPPGSPRRPVGERWGQAPRRPPGSALSPTSGSAS